jgi:hypothetical protein
MRRREWLSMKHRVRESAPVTTDSGDSRHGRRELSDMDEDVMAALAMGRTVAPKVRTDVA